MTAVVEEVLSGRGAWNPNGHATGIWAYAYKPPLPLDGANPDDVLPAMWVDRVRRGIKAIDGLLTEWGYPSAGRDRTRFTRAMDTAARAFQGDHDLLVDGLVAEQTLDALLRPLFVSIGAEKKVHPRWLYGFCKTESGLDPGAQGEGNPPDSGLAQHNVAVGAVTMDQAYDPRTAIRILASRWLAALETYEAESRRLTIDCAIAQHRSPAAADAWFASGHGTGTIIEYVNTVRGNAQEW